MERDMTLMPSAFVFPRISWPVLWPRIVQGLLVAIGLLVVPWLHREGGGGLDGRDALIIFAAATVSSIAGFAFSAICGAMLFPLHGGASAAHIVQMMIVASIATQLLGVASLARNIDWRILARALAGGVLMLPVGVGLLLFAHPRLYLGAAGAFLMLYGIYMLTRRPMTLWLSARLARRLDVVAGALGGLTGGFLGFPGATMTIWCGLRGWTKVQQRSVTQPYILEMQIVTLAALVTAGPMLGRAGAGMDVWSLAYAAPAAAGAICGLALFHRMADATFNRVVQGLLTVSGVVLLWE
jgi:uncharacterized membrane protein YfcA